MVRTRPIRHSSRWFAIVPVAAVLVLAGCPRSGGGGGGYGAPAESPSQEAGGQMGEATTVSLGTTSLGDVLVDAEGLTLYMYDSDTQGSDSTCYDQCASAWPPLLTEGDPAAGEGVDAGLLGTADRTDGTTQVTYDGWPLYYFAQDSADGDVAGQGVNGIWWVLGADGEPIRG